MLRNYLKIAGRNLLKNKTFSLINIAGLSIGMAAFLLILQYVSFQLSFDQFNKNAKDLYRVTNDRFQNGKLIQHGTITYSAIGKAMMDDYPEVINHARINPRGTNIITYNQKKVGDQELIAVDNSFLTMFSYKMLAGDVNTALKEPYTILLTKSAARSILNTEGENYMAALGKMVTIGLNKTPFKVTGILDDVPENSHLQFDALASYVTLYAGEDSWKEADYDFTDSDFWHYVQLKPGTDYKALEAKFPAFSQRHFQGNKVSGSDEKFYLQPLSRAHLYSDYEYEIGGTDSAVVVWGLLIIAVFIIIIAWMNYVNLSTSRSMERAKEVGIRKVAGATQPQLMKQFLTESLIVNIIAFGIALLLIFTIQQPFNNLIEHTLSLQYLFQKGLNGYSITITVLVLLVSGVIASGFYPAVVLSSFKPITVLKGKFTKSAKGSVLRKSLVIGQFAITIILIIGSMVVYQQINFVNNQQLGVNINQLLIIKGPQLTNWDSSFIDREVTFMQEIRKIPKVAGVASSNNTPGNEIGRSFNVRRESEPNDVRYTTRHLGVSKDFIDVYGIKLVAGRNFLSTDYDPKWENLHTTILNESAVKLLGFASNEDAIGKNIISGTKKWEVVGVIKDYHQKSLRFPLEPMRLMPLAGTYSPISIKVNTQDLTATIAAIRKTYDSFYPGNLFDYFFLDEHYKKQYSSDLLFGKIFTIFSGFAIFIASLGLFGLSLFSTLQRTKEIGVRKVLGASVSNIVLLLSKDFIRLVLISFLIAAPLAWFIMHRWLQDFAFRIHIAWWIFLVSGLLAIVIAFATISFQAIKSAVANPVKSLRTE